MISHLIYSDFVFEINTFQQLLKYNKFTTHLLECNLYIDMLHLICLKFGGIRLHPVIHSSQKGNRKDGQCPV